MQIQPLVSIIIPIYNVQQYIERCAKSLFNQSYPNCEFIFINDCTPDNSIEILIQTIQNFPTIKDKIQIINKNQNEGLPQARKTGLDIAQGEYIIHVDSDDWVEKDYVELLVQTAINNNADLVWAGYMKDFPNDMQYQPNKPSNLNNRTIIYEILNSQIHSGVWCKLFKKELYLKNNIIFTNRNYIEDMVQTIQCVKYAKQIAYLPNCKYHYCYNSQSITFSKGNIKRKFEEYLYNINIISSTLQDNLIYYDQILSKRYNTIKYTLLSFYKGNTKLSKQVLSYYPHSLHYHNINTIKYFLLYIANKYGILFPFRIITLIKNIIKEK